MSAAAFDTLEFVETLEKAGIERSQASGIAAAVKAAQEAALNNRVSKHELADLDSNTEKALLRLEHKIDTVSKDLTIRMGSMLMVAVGVILAALKWMH